MSDTVEFIPNAGACLVSRKVLDGEAPVRWMTRRESQAPMDNGWQILSIADTPEYLAEPGNLVIADFNTVCATEPALIGIWDFPVGTELMLHVDQQGKHIIDTTSNREVTAEYFYVPPPHRA
ncbi:MAG: DUF2185 domain-containing protein [Actinobacteria bacterium]|nr:DUF2185 domain-containing protein [Actinomycetota bacterium]